MNTLRKLASAVRRGISATSVVWRWRFVLGLVALGLLLFLLLGVKPWNLPGETGKLKDIVRLYSWWAALANFAAALVLIGLCPWWARSRVPPSDSPRPQPRWFWPMMVIAMVTTAGFAALRLGHSLWDDEEYTLRRSVLGIYKETEDGTPELRRLRWEDTLFSYKKPNNHVFYSVLSRLSLGVWSWSAPPHGLPFAEWAYRLPAYLAGIASVAALGWLLADFGWSLAGVAAAFLLALHPWHLRYASEARGYSLLLLLIPLLLLAWKRGMERGSWRAWTTFGVCQFLLLWTWPGIVYLLLLLNLGTVILFLTGRVPLAAAGRWFFCTAAAGMLVVQLMLPLVPQMMAYLEKFSRSAGDFSWERCRTIFSHYAVGVSWHQTGDGTYPELIPGVLASPELAAWLGIAAAVLIAAGAVVFCRRSPVALVAGVTLALAPGLSALHAAVRAFPVFEWYFLYGILAVCAFTAVALVRLGEGLSKIRPLRHAGSVPVVVFLAAYALLTHPVRAWHLENPIQRLRESVLMTRPSLDPGHPAQKDIMTVGFVIIPHVYDAHVRVARSPEKFFDLLRQADATNKPLFVNVGHPWAANHECPVQWAALHDESLFEEPVILLGIDGGVDRVIARYRPGAMATYDFRSERIPQDPQNRPAWYGGGVTDPRGTLESSRDE